MLKLNEEARLVLVCAFLLAAVAVAAAFVVVSSSLCQ